MISVISFSCLLSLPRDFKKSRSFSLSSYSVHPEKAPFFPFFGSLSVTVKGKQRTSLKPILRFPERKDGQIMLLWNGLFRGGGNGYMSVSHTENIHTVFAAFNRNNRLFKLPKVHSTLFMSKQTSYTSPLRYILLYSTICAPK